jgi:peptide deformylase
MALRTIVTDGHPVLRTRAKEVDQSTLGTPEFRALITDMIETMYHANGVGIAAPQIAEGVRVFIALSDHGPLALVNPVLSERSKKMVRGEEGCLSVPGKFDVVDRHKSVKVDALAIDGKAISFEAKDYFARIIQHEFDHIEGILYVDRVAEQRGAAKK